MPNSKVGRSRSNEMLQEMEAFLSLPQDEISPRMLQRIQMELETIQASPDILFSYGVETDPEEYERVMNIVRATDSRLRNQFGYRPQNKYAGETGDSPINPIQQRYGQRLTSGAMHPDDVRYMNSLRQKEGRTMLDPNMLQGPNPYRP